MNKHTNSQTNKQADTGICSQEVNSFKRKKQQAGSFKMVLFFLSSSAFSSYIFFSFCHSQIYIFFPIDSKFMSLLFLTLCFQYHNHVLVFLSLYFCFLPYFYFVGILMKLNTKVYYFISCFANLIFQFETFINPCR